MTSSIVPLIGISGILSGNYKKTKEELSVKISPVVSISYTVEKKGDELCLTFGEQKVKVTKRYITLEKNSEFSDMFSNYNSFMDKMYDDYFPCIQLPNYTQTEPKMVSF
jgi:hypothetical protein